MTAVEKYVPIFQNAVGDYERKHPHWRIEVFVSLIKWGLKSLKHYIEDVHDNEITWDKPFVELKYPVEWDWKLRRQGDITYGGHSFGKITKRNTADKIKATKTLAKIMASHFNTLALQGLTNGAWFEKQGNSHTPYLPVELSAELNAIKNKRARQEVFAQIVRPFSIGAASIDYDYREFKTGARVPKRVVKQLANINQQMDIQQIKFNWDVNGRKIELSLVFQIHPLIADYDEKKAYHRIIVGLCIPPQVIGTEIFESTPADWPRSERETLWANLLQEVEKIADHYIPKTESRDSVILSVNAKIKIPATAWHPENRSAEIKSIMDGLTQAGELSQINVQPAESGSEKCSGDICPVCGWIHDPGFTQIKIANREAISLRGILPDIVGLVHKEHEKRLAGLSTKADTLQRTCGGYSNPCKAFYDLGQREAYKALFDTSRRGFIALRGFRRKES
jgi:hypothetical protein